MKGYLLVAALVAIGWVATISAQGENLTYVPPEYRRLYPIPGSDFVGFGYDVRYSDPNQAVRLPLVDWSFNGLKTYKYPLYKEYVYRVPDELFTRTVARTDFTGFVYQGSHELSQRLSLGAGVNFSRTDTGPVELTPEEQQQMLQDFGGNITTNGTDTSGANISPSQAGYGDMLTLPVHERGTATNSFSIGVDVEFVKSETETFTKWVTQNEQINQLYQLFLDKRVLRESLAKDIDILAGRAWDSDDRKLFQAFFEKYGTHVVVSAMMGGAISQNSIIDKYASQDTTSVTVGINLNFTASEINEKNETVVQEFVPNRPECENNKDTRGYLFDTLNKVCVVPPEATCFAPMSEVVAESFDDLKLYDPDEEETLDGRIRWRTPGPTPLPVTSQGTRWCPYLKMCDPLETVVVKRDNNTDGFPTFSGHITGLYELDIKVIDKRTADVGSAYFFVAANNGKEQLALVYPSRAFCNSLCRVLNDPWKLDYASKDNGNHCFDYPQHFHFYCDACFYEDGCRLVNPTFAKGPAISVDAGKFVVNSQQQAFTADRIGAWAELQGTKPGLISFLAFAANKNGQTNRIEFVDDGSVKGPDQDRLVASFVMTTFGMGLVSGTDAGNSATVSHVQYSPNTWYQISLQFDWANNKVIMWYNTQGNDTLLKGAELPFQSTNVNTISKIHVFNRNPGTIGQLDDMKFCNAYGDSKYTPVSRESAVQSSTAKFTQSVTGNVDFGFETKRGSMTFSQTSNYRLKGGDSSLVDLLDARKTTEVFETWKQTIAYNPAPVTFVLKKISSLFPTTVVGGFEQRAEMEKAIDSFTTEEITGELIYDQSPDIPGGIPQPA